MSQKKIGKSILGGATVAPVDRDFEEFRRIRAAELEELRAQEEMAKQAQSHMSAPVPNDETQPTETRMFGIPIENKKKMVEE